MLRNLAALGLAQQLTVVALDRASYNSLRNNRLQRGTVMRACAALERSVTDSVQLSTLQRPLECAKLQRPLHVLSLLKEGKAVYVTSPDTTLLDNPLHYMAPFGHDLYLVDEVTVHGGLLNRISSSSYYVRPSARTVALMQGTLRHLMVRHALMGRATAGGTLENGTATDPTVEPDQTAFNWAVRRHRPWLRVRTLSPFYFAGGAVAYGDLDRRGSLVDVLPVRVRHGDIGPKALGAAKTVSLYFERGNHDAAVLIARFRRWQLRMANATAERFQATLPRPPRREVDAAAARKKKLLALAAKTDRKFFTIETPYALRSGLGDPFAAPIRAGKALMAKSSCVFVSVFLSSGSAGKQRLDGLPYLRANIELVGGAFQSYRVVLGTPVDLSATTEEATVLGTWVKEAREGKLAQPLLASKVVTATSSKGYAIDVVANETAYPPDCSSLGKGKWSELGQCIGVCRHRVRICKTGRARNAAMAFLQRPEFDRIDFIIHIDSDMCSRWDLSVFHLAMGTKPPWSAITANGLGGLGAMHDVRKRLRYEDLLAYVGLPNTIARRAVAASGNSKQAGRRFATTTFGNGHDHDLSSQMSKPPFGVPVILDFAAPPIAVESAFGGLAIFRLSDTRHCKYNDATVDLRAKTGKTIWPIEHAGFSQCAMESAPVYLHPGLVIEWPQGIDGGRSTAGVCRASWEGRAPRPPYLKIDVVATARRLYGPHGISPRPLMVWPHPGFIMPSTNESESAWIATMRGKAAAARQLIFDKRRQHDEQAAERARVQVARRRGPLGAVLGYVGR